MKEILDSKNIFAVIGASHNPEKFGYKAYEKLKDAGYTVYPVNPKGGEINGEKVYKDIDHLPQKPDVLNMVINHKIGIEIIRHAHELGINKIWLQPGAESDEILQFCKKNKMECLHNQCIIIQLQKEKTPKSNNGI